MNVHLRSLFTHTQTHRHIHIHHTPVVFLEDGVLREASSNERVKFLLAERLLLGGVALTFDPDAAPVVGGAFGEGS